VKLNSKIAELAGEHDWIMVDGIARRFRTHGYCASDTRRWVVTIKEILKHPRHLNLKGPFHPNLKGQRIYRDQLFRSLRQLLYGPQPRSL
jgi:hypothetical protein